MVLWFKMNLTESWQRMGTNRKTWSNITHQCSFCPLCSSWLTLWAPPCSNAQTLLDKNIFTKFLCQDPAVPHSRSSLQTWKTCTGWSPRLTGCAGDLWVWNWGLSQAKVATGTSSQVQIHRNPTATATWQISAMSQGQPRSTSTLPSKWTRWTTPRESKMWGICAKAKVQSVCIPRCLTIQSKIRARSTGKIQREVG